MNELRLNYAYRARLAGEAEIRLGLAGGFQHRSLRLEDARFPNQYSALTGFDPDRPSGEPDLKEQLFSGTVSPGLWLRLGNFEAGAACRNLVMFGRTDFSEFEGQDSYAGRRWLFFDARYTITVADMFEITPAILSRHQTQHVYYSTDTRATIGLKDRRLFVGGGISYLNCSTTNKICSASSHSGGTSRREGGP